MASTSETDFLFCLREIAPAPTVVERVIVEKFFEKTIVEVEKRVEVPVVVEKIVHVDRFVEVPVDKIVEVPIQPEELKRLIAEQKEAIGKHNIQQG